jgi:hypothetical protein
MLMRTHHVFGVKSGGTRRYIVMKPFSLQPIQFDALS